MATSKVRLNICGSSYVISTSESEDYMQNLADRLNLDMKRTDVLLQLCFHHHRRSDDCAELS